MKLSNKAYDTGKLVITIAVPAIITCIGVIGQAVDWEYTEHTMTVLGALATCAGTILKGVHDTYMEDKIILKNTLKGTEE